MTIQEFISGVTENITNQVKKNSVTPYIVGNSFVELANIVAEIPTGSTSGSSYTFDNGVTGIEGGAYGLGGSLVQDTNLDIQNHQFTISNPSETTNITLALNSAEFSVNGTDNNTGYQGGIALSSNYSSSSWYNGSNVISVVLGENGGIITDNIFNIGLQYADDYSANYSDRSVVDKAYVDALSGGKYKGEWESGVALSSGDLVKANKFLFLASSDISAEDNIYNPFYKIYVNSFSRLNTDQDNINAYKSWSNAANFDSLDDLELVLQFFTPTTNNVTFPLFTADTNILGGSNIEFLIYSDLNVSQKTNQKFNVDQKNLDYNEWRELTPYWSDNDFYYTNSNSRVGQILVDARLNGNNTIEFRSRYKHISGSQQNFTIILEIKKSGRKNFYSTPCQPSKYWSILDNGEDPNTYLENWKGTDASTITKVPGIKEMGNVLYDENGNILTGGGSGGGLSNQTLTENVTIEIEGNQLTFHNSGSNEAQLTLNQGLSFTASQVGGTSASVDVSYSGAGLGYYNGNSNSISLNDNGIIINDTISQKGVEYADDYSVNYTDRSLVDKGYVDSVAGGGNSIVRETPSGTYDGTNDTFILAHTPLSDSECLFLNGQLQEPGAGNDYTITGDTIVMAELMLSTDKLRINYKY